MGSGGECAAKPEARSRVLSGAGPVGSGFFPVWGLCDHSGFLLVLEPVALALDVDGGRVVQQPVEDGRSDHIVGEDRFQVSLAFVRGQGDGPLLVALAGQLEQAGGCERVQGEVANFVEDQ